MSVIQALKALCALLTSDMKRSPLEEDGKHCIHRSQSRRTTAEGVSWDNPDLPPHTEDSSVRTQTNILWYLETVSSLQYKDTCEPGGGGACL